LQESTFSCKDDKQWRKGAADGYRSDAGCALLLSTGGMEA
jgi:hypothetical protein